MEQGVWQEIELLYQKFQKLGISEAVDYDKYYLYSLITHSTAIEGSTLTELDTQLLFDEGVTAKGKPLVHHLMNEDLKQAYELAKVESDSLVPITPAFLKRMNAMLMRTTGSVHSVMGGSFDSSKGEFRLCGVTAGVGGHSYMNYLKVPAKVDELCAILQEKQKTVGAFREQYELSFNAHLNLVTIHPWVDGNGRTVRLLMNYIQFCYHLFPTKIFKEDREEYILSLHQCQDEETNQPFLLHMDFISYVGYDSIHRSFTQLEQDTLLPVLLNSHQQLAEVVVTGEYTSSPLVQASDMGHTRLNKDLIQQTPVLFGEADIIKTLQTLPGVSAGTAGLAGMYVRGGNGDDNLYMIEGNPLYQINHVGGLFSSFNAEAVKDVEFFKSAFPARYGGRLSSVVDIHTKDGNMKEYHGSAMLGLTSGSLNLRNLPTGS